MAYLTGALPLARAAAVVGNPFNTVCLPLKYSATPGVNGVSWEGCVPLKCSANPDRACMMAFLTGGREGGREGLANGGLCHPFLLAVYSQHARVPSLHVRYTMYCVYMTYLTVPVRGGACEYRHLSLQDTHWVDMAYLTRRGPVRHMSPGLPL